MGWACGWEKPPGFAVKMWTWSVISWLSAKRNSSRAAWCLLAPSWGRACASIRASEGAACKLGCCVGEVHKCTKVEHKSVGAALDRWSHTGNGVVSRVEQDRAEHRLSGENARKSVNHPVKSSVDGFSTMRWG